MPSDSSNNRWFAATGIVGVAIVLTLVDATQAYLLYLDDRYTLTWTQAVLGRIPSWMMVALLAPAALAFARRYPLDREHVARRAPLHLAAAFAFALLHLLGRALYLAATRADWGEFAIYMNKSALIAVDMLTYAAIVGAWHAASYRREARDRALAESQLRQSLAQAQLSALRHQLNPHFLFNTLNAISTMSLQRRHDEVVATLGHLGELLRATLDDDLPQEIPIATELELLDRYLEIQRIRFGDRLSVRVEVAAAARDAMVPSMILQPLVENAIVHGVSPTPGPAAVTIRARLEEANLVVEVEDTGPGFGPDAQRGIGLANTSARLDQLYGSAGTLTTGAANKQGGRVCLVLPHRAAAVLSP